MMQTMYGSSVAAREGFFPATESVFVSPNPQFFANPPLKEERDDSVLTYYNNDGADLAVSKKRPREAMALAGHSNDLIYPPIGKVSGWCGGDSESEYFLERDGSVPMMQQQFEIDRLIFLHMEKIKMEMEEQRRRQSSGIIRAIEGAVANSMKVKDDQIEKLRKLNVGLYERVKSLHLENQLWRDLAQSNEATANALRSNLDQLLARLNRENKAADEESCCGSNGHVAEDEYDEIGCEEILRRKKVARTGGVERMCRRCGGAESSVLVLPCRHLCLCVACGVTVDACPVCNSVKSAGVRVHFS